jgi:hypothetical protein
MLRASRSFCLADFTRLSSSSLGILSSSAICETEGFVSVPLEHLPGFLFLVRRHTDHRDQAARTNFFPEFDSDMMSRPM